MTQFARACSLGVDVPREFVIMDRAAIGLGAVFLHLQAEVNWHRLFNDVIASFVPAALARRQAEMLRRPRSRCRDSGVTFVIDWFRPEITFTLRRTMAAGADVSGTFGGRAGCETGRSRPVRSTRSLNRCMRDDTRLLAVHAPCLCLARPLQGQPLRA